MNFYPITCKAFILNLYLEPQLDDKTEMSPYSQSKTQKNNFKNPMYSLQNEINYSLR
jgi:hypothetical protein